MVHPLYPTGAIAEGKFWGLGGPFRVFNVTDIDRHHGPINTNLNQTLAFSVNADGTKSIRSPDDPMRREENYFKLTTIREAYEELAGMLWLMFELAGITSTTVWSSDTKRFGAASLKTQGSHAGTGMVFTGIIIPLAHSSHTARDASGEQVYETMYNAALWRGMLNHAAPFWEQDDAADAFTDERGYITRPQITVGFVWKEDQEIEGVAHKVDHWSMDFDDLDFPGLEPKGAMVTAIKSLLMQFQTMTSLHHMHSRPWSGMHMQGGITIEAAPPALLTPFPLPFIPNEGWIRMAQAQMSLCEPIDTRVLRIDRTSPFYVPLVFTLLAEGRTNPSAGESITSLRWVQSLAFDAPSDSDFRHPSNIRGVVFMGIGHFTLAEEQRWDINVKENIYPSWHMAVFPMWLELELPALVGANGTHVFRMMDKAWDTILTPNYIESTDYYSPYRAESTAKICLLVHTGERDTESAMWDIAPAVLMAESACPVRRLTDDALYHLEVAGARLHETRSMLKAYLALEFHTNDGRPVECEKSSYFHVRGMKGWAEEKLEALDAFQDEQRAKIQEMYSDWGGTAYGRGVGSMESIGETRPVGHDPTEW